LTNIQARNQSKIKVSVGNTYSYYQQRAREDAQYEQQFRSVKKEERASGRNKKR
jgi:hypothetical protein